MILINGVKYSCLECIRGHRSTLCQHDKRPLLLVKRKGRPNFLYPGGNKDYRIAVFAQEVAEDTSEETSEKCRDRTVVILKASDKYVFDIKTGEIVGPYSEEDTKKDPRFSLKDFVNMQFCCLGSLARKSCSCNQKKVLKKRILQSYLKKNQGKVNMENLMRNHSNNSNLTNTSVPASSTKSCCSSKKASNTESPKSCTATMVKSEQHEPDNKINFSATGAPLNGHNISSAVDNSSFNDLVFSKSEPLCNPPVGLQELSVQFDGSAKSFYNPSHLLMFANDSHQNNYPVNNWFPNNSEQQNITHSQFQNASIPSAYSNNSPQMSAPVTSIASNTVIPDMNPQNMPHFDHHAALYPLNANGCNSRPSTNDFLVGDNNQVFKVLNVPSCSVPGSCLCSANCECPSCETHNTSVKTENNIQQDNSSFDSQQNHGSLNFSPHFNMNNGAADSVLEQSGRVPDYYGFLKLVLGIDVENPSPEQLSGSEEGSYPVKVDNDSTVTESEQCSCAAESCFCANCERHGIIEGVRLDDLFGSTQYGYSNGQKQSYFQN